MAANGAAASGDSLRKALARDERSGVASPFGTKLKIGVERGRSVWHREGV